MIKFLFALLLMGGVMFSTAQAQLDTSKPLDLKFKAVDGREVDLAKLRGKVVLIDFWATWCPPCVGISPDIVKLNEKFHDKGLQIIGISVDSDKEAMLKFVKKEGATWPMYFEDSAADNAIAVKYRVEQFPTLWLVGKDGKVIDANFVRHWMQGYGIPRVTSAETYKKLDEAIEKALAAK